MVARIREKPEYADELQKFREHNMDFVRIVKYSKGEIYVVEGAGFRANLNDTPRCPHHFPSPKGRGEVMRAGCSTEVEPTEQGADSGSRPQGGRLRDLRSKQLFVDRNVKLYQVV